MAVFNISVNGKIHKVDVDPMMPLLWVIRDFIGLTGTKYGCGISHCGACTVHIGNQAVRSCVFPVQSVGTMKVTTIEGLSPKGDHPLQKAWQDLDVAQCGYCQAGQIMTAAALLKETPHPTDEQIHDAMTNICRCATYLRIKAAIKQAAEAGNVKVPVQAGG